MDVIYHAVVVGTVAGFTGRLLLLRADYRQYPTYPHAYITHMAMGLIAAFVGSVVLPALVEREFAAVSFLVLVATQFREVRNMERQKLGNLETGVLVPRGPHYVEGIAEVFESRNYLVMLVALIASGLTLLIEWRAGLAVGLTAAVVARWVKRGARVGDLVDIEVVGVTFSGPGMFVGKVFIMNVGLSESRSELERWGVGVTLRGRTAKARDTIHNVGQRQAILHDLVAVLGTRKDVGTPEYTPLARIDQDDGAMGLFFVPQERNPKVVEAVLRRVPILENAGTSAIPEMYRRVDERGG